MRILQIAPQISYPPVDGGKISIYNTTKYLSLRGHQIDYVAYYFDEELLQYKVNLEEICTPFLIKYNTKNKLASAIKNIFSKVPYNFAKYYSDELKNFLIVYFKNKDVDIVHIDHAHMGWVVDVIRPLTKAKIVLREQNFELKIMERYYQEQKNIFLKAYAYIQYRKMLKYEPDLCRKFDNCIMMSKNDEVALLSFNSNIKTSIIPVGVSDTLLNFKKDTVLNHSISHIAPLHWFPNLDGLHWFVNDVLPTVIQKIPDMKLYLIGKETEKFPIPEKFKDNIVVWGFVDDPFGSLLKTQLTIVPLRIGGGIRIKIFELMAIGQPVLSTSIGKEGIEVYNNEHLFVADNAVTFADAIIQALQNSEEVEKMSIRAKRIIREKYTWEKIAESFESLYLETMKNSN